ncbi:MAG: hypothetical protein QOI34_1861, partial [Verrucomicrobiota bacterium]
VLDCWQRAGINIGKRVIDVGAGPGYATIDLAEIVGPSGQVVALERSSKFVRAATDACQTRAVTNVTVHELDLMTDDFPKGNFDFSWCRWVACFVSDPALLVRKIAGALNKGGLALFHEYGHYETWRFSPRRPNHERFRQHVIETWRNSGGEPDAADLLPSLLLEHGFAIRSTKPLIFFIRPADYMWQWPAQFIEVYLPRLMEMNQVDEAFANAVRAEFADAEKDPNSLMLTPLVVEIIAEKL